MQLGDEIKFYNTNEDNSSFESITLAMKLIMLMTYVISVVFAAVVVIMICSKAFLKEQKDLGVYKAFGFTSTHLRLQFSFRFLFVAIIGSAFGVIANVLLNDILMSTLLQNVGITHFVTLYTLPTIFLPVFIISFFFLSFSYLAARKIRGVDTKSLIVE